MAQQPANVPRKFQFVHRQLNQTVGAMAQSPLEEVTIPAEERWPAEAEQERDHILVGEALSLQVEPDLAYRNAPTAKQLPLLSGDILVQDVHNDANSIA
jgi:hypothetical protein